MWQDESMDSCCYSEQASQAAIFSDVQFLRICAHCSIRVLFLADWKGDGMCGLLLLWLQGFDMLSVILFSSPRAVIWVTVTFLSDQTSSDPIIVIMYFYEEFIFIVCMCGWVVMMRCWKTSVCTRDTKHEKKTKTGQERDSHISTLSRLVGGSDEENWGNFGLFCQVAWKSTTGSLFYNLLSGSRMQK